jgi:hypothetical protein
VHSPCPITPPGPAGTLKRPFFKRHPDGSFFFESGKAAQHSNWHRVVPVLYATTLLLQLDLGSVDVATVP